MTATPLLDVNDLTVEFSTRRGIVKAVQNVSISVAKGETLGIVGESGWGKSVAVLAAMGLIAWPGKVSAVVMRFDGTDLLGLSSRERRRLVGKDIAKVKLVVSGAGAAALSCLGLLETLGLPKANIWVTAIKGVDFYENLEVIY